MQLHFALALVALVANRAGPFVPAQEISPRPVAGPSGGIDYFTHVKPKKQRIEAALERGGPLEAWEGCFANQGLNGPQRGWLISKTAGYVSLGRVVDAGTVEVRGTCIALNSDSGNPRGPDRFVYEVVRWGERAYLVPPDGLLDLCQAANSGELLAGGGLLTSYLPRSGDDAKAVSGLPDVPAEYRGYLLDKPVAGTVTGVIGERENVAVWGKRSPASGTSVALDVGKSHKVKAGMTFYPEGKDDGGLRGYVTAVSATRCELLIVSSLGTDGEIPKRLTHARSRWTTTDPRYTTR